MPAVVDSLARQIMSTLVDVRNVGELSPQLTCTGNWSGDACPACEIPLFLASDVSAFYERNKIPPGPSECCKMGTRHAESSCTQDLPSTDIISRPVRSERNLEANYANFDTCGHMGGQAFALSAPAGAVLVPLMQIATSECDDNMVTLEGKVSAVQPTCNASDDRLLVDGRAADSQECCTTSNLLSSTSGAQMHGGGPVYCLLDGHTVRQFAIQPK